MIDTIRISSIVRDVQEDKFDAELRTVDLQTGELKTKLVTKKGIRLTYYPAQGKGMMLAEVSLPKLVKGNNYELIDSAGIKVGLEKIEERLTEVCTCESVSKWHVSRLDSVMSWAMGDNLQDYIRYFRTLPVTGYTLTGYTKDKKEIGSSWIAYSRRVNGYDKDEETGLQLGGLLRLEVQDRNSASVRTLAKRLKRKQTVKDIVTEDVARSELTRWIQRARIDEFILPEDDMFDVLIKEFGSEAAEKYFFFVGYKRYGDQIKSLSGMSESTFRRQQKALGQVANKREKTLMKGLKL